MLFDTFSTNAAQASLDALWLRSQVLTNNLANVDTPGYKAKDVSFSQVLDRSMESRKGTAGSRGGEQIGGASYRIRVDTNDDTSVRVDGNNVSLEKTETELWKTYAQYSFLLDRVAGHYNSINSAIGNMRT